MVLGTECNINATWPSVKMAFVETRVDFSSLLSTMYNRLDTEDKNAWTQCSSTVWPDFSALKREGMNELYLNIEYMSNNQ